MSEVAGILGFQGCIEPHESMLSRIGVPYLRVLTKEDLNKCTRIILPGGESTTMLRFLENTGLFSYLKEFTAKKPTWGICAGSILLAKEVLHPEQKSLGVINIRAHRNYYGSQLDSFSSKINVEGLTSDLEVHFIRAPRLERINPDPTLFELAKLGDTCIFFKQAKIWATAFHVELGQDTRLHEAFLRL